VKHLAVRKAPADEKLRIRVVLGRADGQSRSAYRQAPEDQYSDRIEMAATL
jgi:hypothetical protein